LKISGSHTLPFPPDVAYRMMQDPEVLSRAIPGSEALEKIGENEYRMKMKMALASLSGAFEGKVRITDQQPPSSFRLIVEGSGKIGFMKGDGVLTLTPHESGTSVAYEGEAQVGGTMAAVGQRLIDGASKMLIKRFFDTLATAAPASAPPPNTPTPITPQHP
jgi:carbon monoxide dehydrogenase subunit G